MSTPTIQEAKRVMDFVLNRMSRYIQEDMEPSQIAASLANAFDEEYDPPKKKAVVEEGIPKNYFPPAVIGITGKAGSGKDTLAGVFENIIRHKYTRNVIVQPLAKPLKQEVAIIMYSWLANNYIIPWSLTPAEGIARLKASFDEKLKQDIGRPLYQGFGELARKMGGERFWVERLDAVVKQATEAVIIVPDIRYEIERAYIQSHPRGVLLGLESDTRTGERMQFPEHASEREGEALIDASNYLVSNYVHIESLSEHVVDEVIPFIRRFLASKGVKSSV